MGASSQFHDGVQLRILPPTLLEMFLRNFSYCSRKAFLDDGCDKINELFNFKCNLASRLNKLRDTATELGSKKAFLKTWSSLLNISGDLSIKFN